MQWLQSKLCPCRLRASPVTPSMPTSSATFPSLGAEDNDWEVILENSGNEAGIRSTAASAQQDRSNKTKSKKKKTSSDPRWNAACWPCYGQHISQKGSNQHGSWTKCARCSLRLSYQPKELGGQPEDEAQIIAAALARLRRTCGNDEISADKVKAMIQIIQGERALTASSSQ
jgi:hypothetical protein